MTLGPCPVASNNGGSPRKSTRTVNTAEVIKSYSRAIVALLFPRCYHVVYLVRLDGGMDLSGNFVGFFGQKNRIPVRKSNVIIRF